MEQKSSDNHPITQHFLSTVQSAIRSSFELKQRIKSYFDNLKITMENMDEIWLVVCFIDKDVILSDVGKYELLRKSLMERTSSEYCIKWFQCFLAKSQVWSDDDQDLRKRLFQDWANTAMDNYKNITYVLTATDNLLDAFDDSANKDEFLEYFINYLVDVCFKQGKL